MSHTRVHALQRFSLWYPHRKSPTESLKTRVNTSGITEALKDSTVLEIETVEICKP